MWMWRTDADRGYHKPPGQCARRGAWGPKDLQRGDADAAADERAQPCDK